MHLYVSSYIALGVTKFVGKWSGFGIGTVDINHYLIQKCRSGVFDDKTLLYSAYMLSEKIY